MTAAEKVSAAFKSWVENEDPPPTGIGIAEWLHVIRQHAPHPMTAAEVNEVGREHWGPLHWPEQSPADWDDAQAVVPEDKMTEQQVEMRELVVQQQFDYINDTFNKLHAALVAVASEDGVSDDLMAIATRVDAVHHDFAELVL